MARQTGGQRTDDEGRPRTQTWDGTNESAARITEWSRDGSYANRFMWQPNLHQPDEARTLIEHPPIEDANGNVIYRGDSAEWMVTPVGSVIERLGRDVDAPLVVHLPPKPAAPVVDVTPDPIRTLEAA